MLSTGADGGVEVDADALLMDEGTLLKTNLFLQRISADPKAAGKAAGSVRLDDDEEEEEEEEEEDDEHDEHDDDE